MQASPIENPSFVGTPPRHAACSRKWMTAHSSIRYSKLGNMTCQVILRRGTSSHAVSWEMGDPSVPSLATEIAARLERLARPVESE
jgi:hypothetical protein